MKQIPGIPKKFLDVLKKISLTVHHICDKINQIKEFLESERFARLKALLFQEGKRTICHIRPRKIKGHIKIGTGDPYRTGQLLAVAGIFFPVYGEHITIEPYFEQKILEGNMSVKGRIYGNFFCPAGMEAVSRFRYPIYDKENKTRLRRNQIWLQKTIFNLQ